MKRIFGLTVLTLLSAAAIFADIRIPDKLPPTPTPAPRTIEREAEFGAENAGIEISSAQTIAGGLFLSLAMVCGGVWLARGKWRMPKAAAVRIFTSCLLAILFSSAAFADVRLPDKPTPAPSPKEKKAIDTTFSISIRKDAKEARLLIPKDQIKQLRAQLDELDGDSNNAAVLSFSRTQTIVGGLFLSLGMVFGGVWLTRVRKSGLKPNKTVIAAGLLFCAAFAAVIAYANVGPPTEARSITGRIFTPAVHQYKQASGKIKLETTDDTYGVQLIVPDMPDDTK